MSGQKKPLLFIPLIILLVAIFLISPQKTVHLKSSLLLLFRTPLSLFYRLQISTINAKKIFTFYSEYSAMQKKIKELSYQANRVTELELENQRLRKILELRQDTPNKFIVSRVIGKEPNNWLNSLIIDKGSLQGISINQPVMNFSGLIGKIIEVNPKSAKVLLISDVNSRVVVLVQSTRDEGMLEGIGKGLCRLKYLSVDSELKLGDVVVSAGLGGVYPKGLVVGKIESIKIERGGIYKSCIVKPLSSLTGLEEVLCIESDSNQSNLD
ncbi:MAG: rod shape-determining protein MreC [Candidatus Omnitrophica bacterium]|nr:rod shape-determining protein MreC [Candidatus Omnitrophota bacterium]